MSRQYTAPAFRAQSSGYGWTDKSPKEFSRVIKQASTAFKKLRTTLQFDAIAFTGSSGAAIAFPLMVEHKIPIIYVRKPRESSHGGKIEYTSDIDISRYLIVDDFIDTGSTIKRVHADIAKWSKERQCLAPECVGVFLYCTDGSSTDSVEVGDKIYLPVFRRTR
jgi:orotate phosphoribosyltransferase-like protein